MDAPVSGVGDAYEPLIPEFLYPEAAFGSPGVVRESGPEPAKFLDVIRKSGQEPANSPEHPISVSFRAGGQPGLEVSRGGRSARTGGQP